MSLQLIHDYLSDNSEDSSESCDPDPNGLNWENQNVKSMQGDKIFFAARKVLNSLLRRVEKRFIHDDLWRQSDNSDTDSDVSVMSYLSDLDYGNDSDNDNPKCLTKGELTLEDLPPIEKLQISVDTDELTQLGFVSSIVDRLVVIQSFKNIPAIDLDSVLFCKEGAALGKIFDVIGPVKQPNYVLRFNSINDIKDSKLEINYPIYYIESTKKSLTKYVFVDSLIKEKGSDASWKHNNEPPPEVIDYSDDETERIENWKRNAKSRKKHFN